MSNPCVVSLPDAPEPTLTGPGLAFINKANVEQVAAVGAGEVEEHAGGTVWDGWNEEDGPPEQWSDELLKERFLKSRDKLQCPSCLAKGMLNLDGHVKGSRRVKCAASVGDGKCGKSMALTVAMTKLSSKGKKTLSTLVKSLPPAKVRQVARFGKQMDAELAVDQAEAMESGAHAAVGPEEGELEVDHEELVDLEMVRSGYSHLVDETVDEYEYVMERRMMSGERDPVEELEQRVWAVEKDLRADHAVHEALKQENAVLREENASIKQELTKLRETVEMLAARHHQQPVALPTPSISYAKAALPSAASPVNVIANRGEWNTAGRRKEATTKELTAPGSKSFLSALAEQQDYVASKPAQESNRFAPLARIPEPVVPDGPRPKMTYDQARAVMLGKGLNKNRPVSTIIGAGVNGTVLRANTPKLYRQMLRDVCDVDLRKVLSIGWIGKSTIEIQLDSDYVDTFKALVKNGRIEVDWIVDADPLSVSLFKKGPNSEGGSEAVREAGRKYKARLEDRLRTAVVDSHVRYLWEEITRAEAQITTGVFAPRVPPHPTPMEGVTPSPPMPRDEVASPMPMEDVTPPLPMEDVAPTKGTTTMDGKDPASNEGPGSPP